MVSTTDGEQVMRHVTDVLLTATSISILHLRLRRPQMILGRLEGTTDRIVPSLLIFDIQVCQNFSNQG